jgi:hypothetical protein
VQVILLGLLILLKKIDFARKNVDFAGNIDFAQQNVAGWLT